MIDTLAQASACDNALGSVRFYLLINGMVC